MSGPVDLTGRLVELDGPANFRDLGGYRTRDGRAVHTGRVFRADSLSAMSDRDVQHCVHVLHLHTIVDLRTGAEVDRFSHGPLEREGVTFHHEPIIDETRIPPGERDRSRADGMTLDEIYRMMLERFGDRFATVLRLVADPANHPIVFHCAAGKDRTGLTAALTLGLLDVDEETIVVDYAASAQRMPEMIARNLARAEAGQDALVEVAQQHYEARAEAMEEVLRWIDAEHGSIEGYLRAQGLEPEAISSLRAALLG
jgi:protein-tyrosine phosphatase